MFASMPEGAEKTALGHYEQQRIEMSEKVIECVPDCVAWSGVTWHDAG